jgi:MarR family transcriptional regulator, organic hydroperoxide resistance regulator
MSRLAKGELKLDEQLCFALYSASRLVTRAYRPILEALSLTYPQYLLLMVLWERSALGESAPTVGALATRLMLDSSTITPLVKRLEQRGVLGRVRDPNDDRVVFVELTDEGYDLEEQAMRVPSDMMCGRETEIAALVDLRDRVRIFVEQMNF